jgi:hypothetical protein
MQLDKLSKSKNHQQSKKNKVKTVHTEDENHKLDEYDAASHLKWYGAIVF